MPAAYDSIGKNYSDLRKPDARIGACILRALGDAQSVINVGAGSGSYEPVDRSVTAVEPSIEMIRQRPPSAAAVVQGYAEDLPFDDNTFDAALAILTIHHWNDKARGFAEMRRVARDRIVLFTFDPAHRSAWLLDYFPEFADQDDLRFPKLSEYQQWLGPTEVTIVPIPHDCTDGFLYAYWRRPRAYLDPNVRAAISSFWALEDAGPGLAKLESDLDSGIWEQRYGWMLERESFDFGYRIVSANLT